MPGRGMGFRGVTQQRWEEMVGENERLRTEMVTKEGQLRIRQDECTRLAAENARLKETNRQLKEQFLKEASADELLDSYEELVRTMEADFNAVEAVEEERNKDRERLRGIIVQFIKDGQEARGR